MSGRRRGSVLAACGALALCASAVALPAQQPCPAVPAAVRAQPWDAPLDRRVSLRARDVALRDALERLSATSGIALAYSPDLVALDRRVCVTADSQPLGDVLDALVSPSGAAPAVVAGRVVLVPRPNDPTRPPVRRERVDVLERVVVTGNAVATARRPLTIGVEVIDGARLRRQSLTSLAEILDAAAPGTWLWPSSPSSVLAQYGGIRGASSFGSSAPKIYLDGVEVANPLLLTQVNPDAIDHIEIIRGPQGSALYGSDAISGVVNVITRHDAALPAGSRVQLVSTAGASRSSYGNSLVPTNDQRISARAGSTVRSAGLAAQFGQNGPVFPFADTRSTSIAGDARAVGAHSVWTLTGRLLDRRSGAGRNPLLVGLSTAPPAVDSAAAADTMAAGGEPQSAREYTVGGNLALSTDGAWTHTALLGIDGYRLHHVLAAAGLYPVPTDTDSGGTDGSGDRTTLRLGSVGRFGGTDGEPATTVTVGLDHSVLRLVVPSSKVTSPSAGMRYPVAVDSLAERWNHDTGIYGQLSAAWNDAFFVSAGLRIERNDAFTGADRHPLLPMLGVASVHDVGPASVKLRAAYGKGIRPPVTPARSPWLEEGSGTAPAAALDPEAQAGTELGVELYVGRALSVQVTRFDQTASGLIQNVLVAVDTQMHAGRVQRHMLYQLQNVGEIGNHGWELQGSVAHEAFTLASALTSVSSRVRTVARGYGGDLRPGDRTLGVPARTASLTASWATPDWSAALSASRAMDWINYDRLALARDYAAAESEAHELAGAKLRGYWMHYEGDTHLRFTGSRAVRDNLDLLLTAENLLGGQLGEPDNVTIRPGRTITGGLRARF